MNQEQAEALIPRFKLEKLLNQDQGGRRIVLLGSIDDKPALLNVERGAFAPSTQALRSLLGSLAGIQNLGANDIYFWYVCSGGSHPTAPPEGASATANDAAAAAPEQQADLKLSLIHPCTPKHIAKYTPQRQHIVLETPALYAAHVEPYIAAQTADPARVSWVYNILEGRTEQEDVIARSDPYDGGAASHRGGESWLLLPDLNWDRRTAAQLRLLCLVARRDVRSVRDLRVKHIPWLRRLSRDVKRAVVERYGGGDGADGAKEGTLDVGDEALSEDGLKLYAHYHPTYYHFHVHVVAARVEPNATQAVGKAFSIASLVGMLAALVPPGKRPEDEDVAERGIHELEIEHVVGEESALWKEVFGPVARGEVEG